MPIIYPEKADFVKKVKKQNNQLLWTTLKSDLDTMEFTWLNWKTIIDYTGDIKQEIIDNREELESEDKNIITYDDYHTQPQTYHRFKSEKFFLHYVLERDICIKKLGFDLKFRNRIYG